MSTEARFQIQDWDCDCGNASVLFHYKCSEYGPFTESVRFPAEFRPGFREFCERHRGIIGVAHRILGVSYYKAAAAPRIHVKQDLTGPAELEALRALYSKGLGEFYYRNGLPFPPQQQWVTTDRYSGHAAGGRADEGIALQAFGGGKESQVVRHLLAGSTRKVHLAGVSLTEETAKVIASTTPEPVLDVRRRLDPALIEANRAGALNGHVPVTAINSAVLAMLAGLLNASWLVFGNEAAAEEPTLSTGTARINHQYSKTLEWEKLFAAVTAAAMPEGFRYFSLLRPVSELWIARALAGNRDALAAFRSCNRNFRQDPAHHPGARRWCGKCAKCAFTALTLAPFLGPERSLDVFGSRMLDDPALLDEYRAIAGLTDQKPWDCVGSVREARAVFARLGADPRWKDCANVREIIRELPPSHDPEALSRDFEAAVTGSGPHNLPPGARALLERNGLHTP
ncbi:MAG: endonuclease domain-containing protein [Alphaproteobacteria bacterium]